MKLRLLMKKIARRILGRAPSVTELRQKGAVIGENCHIYGSIDNGHEYLVTIGNNVTLASGSRLLTHDGSTKKILGYSKIGRIDIGDDVFIGAYSIVLPNVKIGSRVVIGAGSIVSRDIPDNSVAVGSPAKVIGTYDDYESKNRKLFEVSPVWETHYSKKTDKEKQEQREVLLKRGIGFDD